MSLKPNIDYTIRLKGETFVVKIELSNLEEFGLLQCLRDANTFEFESEEKEYEVTFRKIHLTPFDADYKPKERVVGGSFSQTDNRNDKPYLVHLNTIVGYKEQGLPETIEVDAVSPAKAVVRALHKLKIFKFPKGWQNTKVSPII